jgi:hypothetical protein
VKEKRVRKTLEKLPKLWNMAVMIHTTGCLNQKVLTLSARGVADICGVVFVRRTLKKKAGRFGKKTLDFPAQR